MDISNNNQGLYDLPDSWEWVTIGEITEINPKLPESNYSDNLEVSFIPMKAVEAKTGIFDLSEIKKFSEVKKGYTAFTDEDIILAKITPCLENGKIAILKNLKNKIGFGSTEFHVIRVINNLIFHKYIYFFCQNSDFIKDARKNMTGSAGQLRVSSNYLKATLIPLPPLNEQKRIVEKIEELFTKLDAGIELLKKLQVKLKRYRQSVLKSAVEGKLTEEWRQANKANLEPAEILLKRILQERREKWEAEQVGKKTAKYQEPMQPDISNLPDLPEGWCWASIEQLLIKIQYGSSSKTDENENGIPVLRMGNIVDGKLILNDLKYLPNDHSDFPELLLQSHDLLFNRTNSFELVGKTSVYQGHPNPCSFASYLIRVRFNNKIKSKYISFFINSMYGRKWIISVVSQQVGQANVNGTKLKALKIPLPPLQEQNKIVEEIDRIFSVTDQLEKIIERNIKRAEKLRQSILKQAFTGKLVPQDINDEPAAKLLEKIKQEKAKSEPKKKTTKRSKGNS